jgi:hypothetical protein
LGDAFSIRRSLGDVVGSNRKQQIFKRQLRIADWQVYYKHMPVEFRRADATSLVMYGFLGCVFVRLNADSCNNKLYGTRRGKSTGRTRIVQNALASNTLLLYFSVIGKSPNDRGCWDG